MAPRAPQRKPVDRSNKNRQGTEVAFVFRHGGEHTRMHRQPAQPNCRRHSAPSVRCPSSSPAPSTRCASKSRNCGRNCREAHAGREHLAARLAALVSGLPGGVLVLDARGRSSRSPIRRPSQLLGEPLLEQTFAAVLARAVADAARHRRAHRTCAAAASSTSRAANSAAAARWCCSPTSPSRTLMQVLLRAPAAPADPGRAGRGPRASDPHAARRGAAVRLADDAARPQRARTWRAAPRRPSGSLKQLDRLVNDMLAFAHGGAAPRTVSVSALLEQVAQWLRPALQRGVRLTIRTRGAGPHRARQCAVAGVGGA